MLSIPLCNSLSVLDDPPSLTLDPASITGLVGWWRAEDLTALGLTQDQAVDTWPDASGMGRSLIASGSARPLFRASGFGNASGPAARFDGVDDRLDFATPLGPGIDFCAFVVFRLNKSFNNVLLDASPGYVLWVDVQGFYIFDGQSLASFSIALPLGSSHLVTVRREGGTVEVLRNGASLGTSSLPTNLAMTALHVGARADGTRPFAEDLAELLFYNVALSAGDRSAVELHLQEKWGI